MTKADQIPLAKLLATRIAVIDGAMGTTIRTYGMTEADIRGERFKDAKKDLLNNGDLFSLTQPEMIGDIHRRFLEAGQTSSRPTPLARPRLRKASFLSTIRASTAAAKTLPFTRR